MAELVVIGLNHRTAPVEVREHLALPGPMVAQLLATFHAEPVLDESLLLATCNRTELYAVPRPGHDLAEYLLGHIGRLKGAPVTLPRNLLYRYDDQAAARHLFRVAAALDSQIVGEHQILGQVRAAYRAAVSARTAGFLLNKTLHWAFRVGKRVQTETQLGRGAAGIAPAAVDLARQIFSSLGGKTALLVGAGQTAECAAQALVRAGAGRLIVANRTLYRAQQLAYDLVHKPAEEVCDADGEPCGEDAAEGPVACPALLAQTAPGAEAGSAADARAASAADDAAGRPQTEAVGLEDLAGAIARADLVITSTGSESAVLTFDALADVLRRRNRPLLIIDIAVPRDVDERLGKLGNVFLYNIDDLNRLVGKNLERRRQEVPRAEAIVEDELAEFAAWLASLQVAPTIRLLREFVESLQQTHIERYGKKFTDADRAQLEQFTQTLISQILHRPTTFLRGLSGGGSTSESLETADLVRRLFGLDSRDSK